MFCSGQIFLIKAAPVFESDAEALASSFVKSSLAVLNPLFSKAKPTLSL